MRLWSLHPRHLDRQGLTACWREGLLAQAVLAGATRGYRNHPQLIRFRVPGPPPGTAVTTYLHGVADEAGARGYSFDRARVRGPADPDLRIEVTTGQVEHEWGHLLAKLAGRSPDVLARWAEITTPDVHPLFVAVPGPVQEWEVVAPGG